MPTESLVRAPCQLQMKARSQGCIARSHLFNREFENGSCLLNLALADRLTRVKEWLLTIQITGEQTTV